MQSIEIKSPEELLNGTVKYSDEEFRADIMKLHEVVFADQKKKDSLNT